MDDYLLRIELAIRQQDDIAASSRVEGDNLIITLPTRWGNVERAIKEWQKETIKQLKQILKIKKGINKALLDRILIEKSISRTIISTDPIEIHINIEALKTFLEIEP